MVGIERVLGFSVMGLQLNWLAVNLFAIAVALVVQGSTGDYFVPSIF